MVAGDSVCDNDLGGVSTGDGFQRSYADLTHSIGLLHSLKNLDICAGVMIKVLFLKPILQVKNCLN